MSSDSEQQPEFFYNLRTKMVEIGRLSSWEDLMGPYSTRAQAEEALETAKQRSDTWDDADDEWSGQES